MPTIMSSSDLKNRYEEVSDLCHEFHEPVFVTREGEGDLAVMSLETYNDTVGRLDLYKALMAGLRQFETGETIPGEVMMKKIARLAGRN
jgi:PHD/YefM family antitoxin component YafN of YafNO toxin-antitoxin module